MVLASLRAQERSPNKIVPTAQREWNAAVGAPWVVGDSMVGSQREVNQGTTAGGDKGPAGVRASVVARKRVTTVEPRDAGKWWLLSG